MNKLKKEEFAYSHNAEEFYGYYESREEAIREGSECADENQKHIYTGKVIEPNLEIDVDWLIDYLTEKAYEQSGGYSDNYGFLHNVTDKQISELETGVNKVLVKWIEKYHKVNFFTVDSVSMHKFRE